MEWHEKRSLFAKWAILKHSDILYPEKCFVESTKISIGPYLNEKLCQANQIFVGSKKLSSEKNEQIMLLCTMQPQMNKKLISDLHLITNSIRLFAGNLKKFNIDLTIDTRIYKSLKRKAVLNLVYDLLEKSKAFT